MAAQYALPPKLQGMNASLTPFVPGQPSAAAQTVSIDLGDRSYRIAIGTGLLGNSATYAACPKAAQALVVTNTTVAPLYAKRLVQAISPLYQQVQVLALPDGEQYKDGATLNLIYDQLLGSTADRKKIGRASCRERV